MASIHTSNYALRRHINAAVKKISEIVPNKKSRPREWPA
jgi:hypothetical protein